MAEEGQRVPRRLLQSKCDAAPGMLDVFRLSLRNCGAAGSLSVSHLVQVDAGVHGSFGLAALQVSLHSLLTHAHSGKHLSGFLKHTHGDNKGAIDVWTIAGNKEDIKELFRVGFECFWLTGNSLWFSGSRVLSFSRP